MKKKVFSLCNFCKFLHTIYNSSHVSQKKLKCQCQMVIWSLLANSYHLIHSKRLVSMSLSVFSNGLRMVVSIHVQRNMEGNASKGIKNLYVVASGLGIPSGERPLCNN